VTPAEELTAAVDKLGALTDAASHGPWIEAGIGDYGWSVIGGDYPLTSNFAVETEDSEQGKADAAYIAAMNPLIGKALAEWLRSEAQAFRGGQGRGFDGADLYRVNPRALALARLINGAAP
jgi:hypothetical protein